MKMRSVLGAVIAIIMVLILSSIFIKQAKADDYTGYVQMPCTHDRIGFMTGTLSKGFYMETSRNVEVGSEMQDSKFFTMVNEAKRERLTVLVSDSAMCLLGYEKNYTSIAGRVD